MSSGPKPLPVETVLPLAEGVELREEISNGIFFNNQEDIRIEELPAFPWREGLTITTTV